MVMDTRDKTLTKVEREIYCQRRYLAVLIEDDPEFMQEQGRQLRRFGKWMETVWGGVSAITMKDKLSATKRRYNGLHEDLKAEAKIHGIDKPRGRPTNVEKKIVPMREWAKRQ